MNLKQMGFTEINHSMFLKTQTPYKIYAELLDETSQKQFNNVLAQKYVTYATLMPDAHAGYSMPIGGVCATKDVVVPQFVGFDIGCGMCAYKTDFSKEEVRLNAEVIYSKIVEKIPLGFSRHKNHQPCKIDAELTNFAQRVLDTSGLKQLGTLGGGNHFIELGYGSDDKVWIIVHSGSRGFGHKIASHYMLQAYLLKHPQEGKLEKILEDFEQRNRGFKEHNPEGFVKSFEKFKHKQILEINKKIDLDNLEGIWGLDVNTALAQDYIKDQNYALAFALENRKRMIEVIHTVVNEVLKKEFTCKYEDETRFINRNHNHTEFDTQRGEWIHRKGATHAKKGLLGVIPANMRDGCFIVKGKGNEDSLMSSSHGAGRVMSRRKAKKEISFEDFKVSMQGIKGTVDENTLDESPFAYKDIFEVMRLQSDLIEVLEHINVIINVKDNSKRKF